MNNLPHGIEIWSCNPKDIPPWTPEAKQRLVTALGEIFGWKKERPMTPSQREEFVNDNRHQFFQHKDGGVYQFLDVGQQSDDSEKFRVVYLHIWPFTPGCWLRPVEEWTPDRFRHITIEEYLQIVKGDELHRLTAQVEITDKREARKGAK